MKCHVEGCTGEPLWRVKNMIEGTTQISCASVSHIGSCLDTSNARLFTIVRVDQRGPLYKEEEFPELVRKG
jgi:hypothetical protein